MLSVPLVLFRGGDAAFGAEARELATLRARKRASGEWVGRLLAGVGAPLALLGDGRTSVARAGDAQTTRQQAAGRGDAKQRAANSPCPSSSSSSLSSSSSSSDSSASASSSDSSNSSSDNEDEAPPPPAGSGNGGGGNGGDDQKKKDDEDEDDGNSSDSSSSSDSSAGDDSDQEEDDGVMLDTDDEQPLNGVDPTDDDLSGESDGSSDLENSYPRLPSAPVDTLIAFRQQAAQKELQLTKKLKNEVIEDAKQRQQERRDQAQRSKRKKKAPQSKRRHSKQSDVLSNRSGHLGHHSNGSAGTVDVKMVTTQEKEEEDEWLVDCSCGLKEKNYDDGTSMIQCDSCSHWVHAKCADKQPEAVAQEKFMCFRCSWMFDCVCAVRRRPNHDDGQRMVECESCKTWQHTMCVGIPMTEEPPDDYRCPRCVKKSHRRKSELKTSGSRDRQRKRSHAEPSRHHRKSKDASPVVAVDVRSSARAIDSLTTPTRLHRSRRTEARESPKMEKKLAQLPPLPPVPAASPPTTPPPPPSTPPPPSVVSSHALPGSTKHDRSHGRVKRRSEREREHSSASTSSSHRKRDRSLGENSTSTKTYSQSEQSDVKHHAPPPSAVTPSPRGKGLMLRGYSPASSRANATTSESVDVRPPLPLTPPSGGASSGNSYSSNNGHGGRKRKTSSARDRLAKKLKIKKSTLR
ncbi:unnamed protein product [Phytophthora lilii]|uniref:Unnamed protein product n=1 Tax=Phytophthora lilii TaxID=2077276 RepID=A0A9W6THF4_9STRA|nr:unnamed protein product [Phytophthora lilii]